MNFQSKNERIISKLDKINEETEPKQELKKTELLERFNNFFQEIQKLEADDDHVRVASILPVYNDVFGSAGAGATTLAYRIKTLAEKFPDDILIDPESKTTAGNPIYYIDRTKKDLLQKIYFPATKVEQTAPGQEMSHLLHIEAMQNLGILEQDYNDEELE